MVVFPTVSDPLLVTVTSCPAFTAPTNDASISPGNLLRFELAFSAATPLLST